MKNPVTITLNDLSSIEIGDPFILRFNGKYYLYCSTSDDVEGIRCFVSDDLLNYRCYGLVAKSPLLKYAYAPEVIYKDDEFIMATSPKGHGHYFLKAKSPLGPFEFISNNLQNMIDGSFVNDKKNNLHFLRADHNGIAYLDYKNNKLINRIDLLPQISGAWTEGPSITYYKDYYYATYCGNDVLSDNYRIKIASSKYLEKNYKVQVDPLLLSTDKDYYALGHNSIVLGPSLDEYFVCYHTLKRLDKGTTRYLCLDRLYLNKSNCICNYSNYEISNPLRPTFECDVNKDNKLNRVYNYLLTREEVNNQFSAEFNFKDDTSIILEYKDELNYLEMYFKEFNVYIYKVNDGNKEIILKKKTNFNFKHFHTIRVINCNKLEVLIDNIHLFNIAKVSKGYIGFKYKEDNLFYFAYTNNAYLSSMKNVPVNIPGKASCLSFNNNLINDEDFNYLSLKKESITSLLVKSNKRKKYRISALMKDKNLKMKVSSSIDSGIVSYNKSDVAYKYSYIYLLELNVDKEDELRFEVLNGEFSFVELSLVPILEEISIDRDRFNEEGELYLFNKYCETQSLIFRNNYNNDDSVFGIILNANNYCNFRGVRNIKYQGYFIGFDKGLLVVDYCQYDRVRIYDKPFHLKRNKKYKLSVNYLGNKLEVYVNDKLEIVSDLKYSTNYGKSGIYKNKYARITILDYKEEI